MKKRTTISFMERIRKAVQKQIDRKKITITAISSGAECSRQAVYNFLDGDNASGDLLEKIARVCNLEIDVREVA